MKNAFKKLFSFMLVAVMLVSVLPVTAMAAEEKPNQFVDIILNEKKSEFVEGVDYVSCRINDDGTINAEDYEKAMAALQVDCDGWYLDNGEEFDAVSTHTFDLASLPYNVYPRNPQAKGDAPEVPETPETPDEKPAEKRFVDIILNGKTSNFTENDYYRCEIGEDGKIVAEDYEAAMAALQVECTGWYLDDGTKFTVVKDHVFTETGINVYPVVKTTGGDNEEKPDPKPEPKPENTYYLHDEYHNETHEITVTDGKFDQNLPKPQRKDYQFRGWFTEKNGKGLSIQEVVRAEGTARDFYAYFARSNDDGLSTLTVYARMYVGGKNTKTVELLSVDLDESAIALDWLKDNRSMIAAAVDTDPSIPSQFTWGHYDEQRYFYNYKGDLDLTAQNSVMKNNLKVCIKLYSTEEPTVQVYVHRKATESADRIIQMNGYIKGDVVDRADVLTAVKKYYSVKTMSDLYDEEDWADLKVDKDTKGAKGVTVDTNDGLVKIHVIVNGSAKSDSKADSSNPKTGDSMFMVMTVMALSATALAGAYIYNKKWMVK